MVNRKFLTLLLLFIFLISFSFNIAMSAESWSGEIIYIRADGSIYPANAPIITYDKITYAITSDIRCAEDGIKVERDNIVIDGNGYTLKGKIKVKEGIGTVGIEIIEGKNVTIKNMSIKGFGFGFLVGRSSNISIVKNSMINNYEGVRVFFSSDIIVYGNNISANEDRGIDLWYLTRGTISGNNIIENGNYGIYGYNSDIHIVGNNIVANKNYGIYLEERSTVTILNNTITLNSCGIYGNNIWTIYIFENTIAYNSLGINLKRCIFSPWICHNDFIYNKQHVLCYETAKWDIGYPSGGNYWSGYIGIDEKSCSDQNQPGSDGIGDSPYIIDKNNRDRYPLMRPWRLKDIMLKDYGYLDALPNTLKKILEAIGVVNVAVKGDFYAILDPPFSPYYISKVWIDVVIEYVKVSERGVVREEMKTFYLKPVNEEFIAEINLETLWPFHALEWFSAFAGSLILRKPEYLIEQIGEDVYLPELLVYIGFERIYIRAKVIKITGEYVSGGKFEIPLDTPLPLKSSYEKLAEWAKGNDYMWIIVLSPVNLLVADETGNRVGSYNGKVVKEMGNMYYFGETGKVQLVLIENPAINTRYNVEIEGESDGKYTLIVGQKIGNEISEITLASGAQIKQGEKRTYALKVTLSGIVEDIPWWIRYQSWIVGAIGISLVAIAIIILRKKYKSHNHQTMDRLPATVT